MTTNLAFLESLSTSLTSAAFSLTSVVTGVNALLTSVNAQVSADGVTTPTTYTIMPATPVGVVVGTPFQFTGVLGGDATAPTDLTYSINPLAVSGVSSSGWSMPLTLTASGSTTIVVSDSLHGAAGSTTFTVSTPVTYVITPVAPIGVVVGTAFTFTGSLGGYLTTPTGLTYAINGGTPTALTGVTMAGWLMSLTIPAAGVTTIVVADAVHSVMGTVSFVVSSGATLAPPTPVGVASGAFLVVPQQTAIATFPTVAGMVIQVTSPVLTNVNAVVFNANNASESLAPPYQYYGDALNDDQMPVAISAAVPFAAICGSLVQNVAVYMHSTQVWTGVPVGGTVTGTINMLTSNHGGPETNGPAVLDVYTWDSAPGVMSTTGYQNKIRVMIFLTGGAEYSMPVSPGASGLTLAFESEWTTGGSLFVSSTNLSAKWFPGDPGGDYGDAIDQDPASLNGGPNPFVQMGNYLRIRCQYSPGVTDPLGYGRKWTTGYLSTCFPGGSGFSAALPYYAECRMLVPIGGAPWPSFWQTTQNALVTPSAGVNIETDTVELYGLFPTNWRSGGILYPYPPGSASVPTGAAATGGTNNNNQPGVFPSDAGFFDFHTFGVLVTSGTTTFYVDNVATGYYTTPALPMGLTGPRRDFFMMDNQFGGGWAAEESELPYSSWYDAWFHCVRVYT